MTAHHDDYGGLQRDLIATGRVLSRRDALRFALSAGGLYLIASCADDVDSGCLIPAETAGPFPGDGSNGPNVLTQTGVVRSDIRSSFAGLTGTAVGIALTLQLTLVSATDCVTPLADHAIYAWHCDREGRYSLYTAGVTDQNYLRGLQGSNATGLVTFQTIFPGCYAGRWPHIHFEVFSSLAEATAGTGRLATSQLAFPEAECDLVYATTGYEQSVTNLAPLSLASDGIFRDGAGKQTATMSGDVSSGFTAELTVAV
jgi:protocatechuate 3,4-dioxygenase beta subunit